jgi:hypothetical protein
VLDDVVSVRLLNSVEVVGVDEATPGLVVLRELFRLVAQHDRVARAEYSVTAGYVPVPNPAAGGFEDLKEKGSIAAQFKW